MTYLRAKTILISLLLFTVFQVKAQDNIENSFKGSIRYILEESFEGDLRDSVIYKNGKDHQFSWIQDNKMEFDQNMNLIKRSFYDDDKTHLRTETYDFQNNTIKKKVIQSFTYIYTYDANGLVSEELLVSKTDTNDVKLKQRFSHDENGQLANIWEFDMNGGHVRHQRNTYNEKGKLTRETIKYKDGVEYKTYSYTDLGLLEKVEWYDYQYGLLERTTYYYIGKKMYRKYYESYDGGALESTIEYKYDKYENPISILEINEKRRIREHEVNTYEYDLGDNWVKKTTAINESLFYIVERRIRYYI